MSKYLISGEVYFDDDLYELSLKSDPEYVLNLGATASRCLQMLLEANREIVTKSALLFNGWQQYNNVVTDNSLNQAIAQIRKNFILLNMHAQSIVTVPRIGYKISNTISIENIDNDISIAATRPILPPVFPTTSPLAIDSAATEISSTEKVLANQSKRHKKNQFLVAIFLLINCVCAFLMWHFMGTNVLKAARQVNYVAVKQQDGTNYFAVQNVVGGAEHIDASIATLRSHAPKSVALADKKYVYINGSLRDGVFSYLLCQSELGKLHNGCVSYVILLNRDAT